MHTLYVPSFNMSTYVPILGMCVLHEVVEVQQLGDHPRLIHLDPRDKVSVGTLTAGLGILWIMCHTCG